MNSDLLRNNYLVVPNFITPEHAEKLRTEFHLTDSKFKFSGDPQAPNSASVWNYLPALELLANKTSHVSEIVGETVLPTYVYSRIYRNGSVLTKHTDRPACEVSMTLHLGGDKPWAIWIETPEKEKRCVSLNPGDAMLYLGCIAPHWRDKFDGEHYTQFFLHYVRSRGYCSDAYFDRERNLDENFKILKEEYRKMAIHPNNNASKKVSTDHDFFDTMKPQSNKLLNKKNLESMNDSKSNSFDVSVDTVDTFIDLDDVVIANAKYSKFFTKKESTTFNKLKEKVSLNEDIDKNQNSIDEEISEQNKSTKPLKDFILHIPEYICPDLCDDILDEYANTDYWTPTETGSGHDPSSRKCAVICVSEHGIIKDENQEVREKFDEELFQKISELVKIYQSKNPYFELEVVEDTGYELLRYEEGDFYIEHTDHFKTQPRSLTVILSMNDAYEGGEIALFNRELVYKLNVGDALVFPSNFMFPHEVMPVTSGTRFSLITWIV